MPTVIGRLITFIRQRVLAGRIPEGKWGIRLLGYRNYVGGKWEEIGKLQFEYLKQQGLNPSDCLLDVACGAMRGGVHFVRYLDKGKYLGIDKEQELIEVGKKEVLGDKLVALKEPEFVLSDKFEFKEFSKKPNFSLAISLFTHLDSDDISLCLKRLRDFVDRGHVFYTTFFEGDSSRNKSESHSLDHFEFSKKEMMDFGEQWNWESRYVGDWHHPRRLMMIKYTAR